MSAISGSELLRIIPHRAPMLLVDSIDELVRGVRGTGTKSLTAELPNTLLIDALGQVAIAVLSDETSPEPAVWYLASLEDVQLGAPAGAGDTLRLEATITRAWKTTVRFRLRASLANDRDVVNATMVLSNAN
jgi:3-hydroxyacyl-[acyl-carrier-protein] dehydratase